MVGESGQLFTMEGVAAGILMIVTAYLVMSTTSVLTQQDVHITDMQLEQLGNDALAMMDTPDSYGNQSMLALVIAEPNVANRNIFNTTFLGYLDATTNGGTGTGNYAYNATIYYRNSTNAIKSYPFFETHTYYRENAVKVIRWVYLPNGTTNLITDLNDDQPHSVLLEVLLWRQ